MRRPESRRVALDLHGLIGRHEIFRIAPGVARDPAVRAWLADGSNELRPLAQQWFLFMRRCGQDVRESMHDGCPVACVEDAPFAYVNTFKRHLNVGFFNGAHLEDAAGILEGNGRHMRHVKLKPDAEVDATALRNLIDAAYADIKARLDAARSL